MGGSSYCDVLLCIDQQNICQLGCIMPATVDCRHITHAKVCQHVYDCPGSHCTETVCTTCTVKAVPHLVIIHTPLTLLCTHLWVL